MLPYVGRAGVEQPGECLTLRLKPRQDHLRIAPLDPNQSHGHAAFDGFGLVRHSDAAHPTFANLLEQLVRNYLVYLVRERQYYGSHYNVTVCALRFLYRVTLNKNWPLKHAPYARQPKNLSSVFSRDEGVRLLAHVGWSAHRN